MAVVDVHVWEGMCMGRHTKVVVSRVRDDNSSNRYFRQMNLL